MGRSGLKAGSLGLLSLGSLGHLGHTGGKFSKSFGGRGCPVTAR